MCAKIVLELKHVIKRFEKRATLYIRTEVCAKIGLGLFERIARLYNIHMEKS